MRGLHGHVARSLLFAFYTLLRDAFLCSAFALISLFWFSFSVLRGHHGHVARSLQSAFYTHLRDAFLCSASALFSLFWFLFLARGAFTCICVSFLRSSLLLASRIFFAPTLALYYFYIHIFIFIKVSIVIISICHLKKGDARKFVIKSTTTALLYSRLCFCHPF